ncbi:NAD(P)-dependent hydrogenase/sulfhydrogenase 2 subunit delta [Thermococcus sp. ES12]|uniref:NAD(P)-dependent hydrogenase/sulfhydrogenase 2 subunit delta n=1 Tax=Thermococcus sp. ES12 TaxID=1638246 RepID=UPI001431AC25|nr:NAD(P)-dependent hydrogenase/sulfhydrogenase 2 subunit delta [Thermococcus sp. ES12]NJE75335.1 hydrogenase [Thermococcus sp. ES12]
MMDKLKLAVFELTDCGGCALNMLFLYERLFDLLEFYEITEFHMATSLKVENHYDVALVTGTVSTQRDLNLLKEARNHSDYLIALGTCATHGSVQASVELPIREKLKAVYGDEGNPMRALDSKPVVEYVAVDFALPGCPYDKNEVYQVLLDIAKDVEPVKKDYPVCLECKLNEYECVLVKKGLPCLGPITYGGCNAVCVRSGLGCIGCRGPLPGEVNPAGEYEILKELGYDDKYIIRKFKTFARWEP